MIGQAGDSEDDVVLAGECALGLLEGEARAAFEARLANEPRLAALLRDWSAHFAALAEETESVSPTATLKSRIEAELFGAPGPSRRWRWGGGIVAAFAVAVAALVVVPDALFGPPDPAFTADLVSADGVFQIHFGYIEEDAQLLVRRDAGAVPLGRDQEFWLIPEGGAPISMGTITDDGSVNAYVVTTAILAILPTATLAVSDEPDGGSPTGQPTGDIIVAGMVPVF